MNKTLKLSLVAFAIIAGTLLLMAGIGGTGPRYVGRFFGDGTGLSNSVDIVAGPNINVTPGPGNRAYTIESTAAGAAGIFTNGIMGYGDEYRTNYVRISPSGVSLTGGGSFAGDGSGLTNVNDLFWRTNAPGGPSAISNNFAVTIQSNLTVNGTLSGFGTTNLAIKNSDNAFSDGQTMPDLTINPDGSANWRVARTGNNLQIADTVGAGGTYTFAGGLLTSSGGFLAGGGRFTGSGLGLTNLQVQTALNVMNYGATTNDDNSDDTAAFQAALNALDPLGGGVVFAPRGYYFLTQITMNKGATLAGEGTADGKGTQINQLAAAGDVPMIIISNAPGATIRDLMLQGVNTSGVGAKPGTGVTIRGQSMHARLANLKIWFFKTGIHMTNTWTHTIDNVWCSVNGDGIDTDGIVNAVNIRGGEYSANTNGIHLDLTSSGSWMISGTTIEGNIGKGVWVETLRGPLSISDCYFELNGDFDIHAACHITDVPDSAKLSIEDNFFNNTPTNIFLSQIPNTIIEGSRVVAAGSTVFVSADAVCTNIALPHNVGDAALTIYAPTAGRIEYYNGTNLVNSLVSDRLAYGSMWAQGGSGMTNNAQNMRATNYFASDSDGVGVNLVAGYITNWLAGTYKLTATVAGFDVGSAGPAIFSFRTNDVSTLRTFSGYIDLDRGASGHAVVVAPANTRFSLHINETPSMTWTTNYEFTVERLK